MSNDDYVLACVDEIATLTQESRHFFRDVGVAFAITCILDGLEMVFFQNVSSNELFELVSSVDDYRLKLSFRLDQSHEVEHIVE